MEIQSISIRIDSPNERFVIDEMLSHMIKIDNKAYGRIVDNVLQIRITNLQDMIWACQNGFGIYQHGNTPSWVTEIWTELRNIAMMNEMISKFTTHDVYIMERE